MASSIYTFWQLLNGTQDQPKIQKIRIPIIQRDYAQGRTDEKTELIRKKLVADLYQALQNNKKLRLDFVYGSQEDGFVPLDGQQRLTTLFLLHWYLAAHEGELAAERDSLKRFTYETRTGARDFCGALVGWEPDFTCTASVSTQLTDTAWYRPVWAFDPTVQGMMVMLDELHSRFQGSTGLFDRLVGSDSPIDFHFLDMQQAALTDDLYLKMNARGKALTDFENWRASFDQFLEEQHPGVQFQDAGGSRPLTTVFGERMDGPWLDLFWEYRDTKTSLTDAAAQNAVVYVTRMLAYELGIDERQLRPDGGSFRLPFSLYERVYADPQQVTMLFRALDLLAAWKPATQDASELPAHLLAGDDSAEPVRLFSTNPDLLRQCLREQVPSLQTQVLLYTLLAYGTARQDQPLVPNDMRNLLRIVRNVLERERQQNDTKINSNLRYERLATLIPAVGQLARAAAQTTGGSYAALAAADPSLLSGLSTNGKHEQQKAILIENSHASSHVLHRLENLPVLHGDLHNLPLDPTDELIRLEQALTEIWSGDVEQHRIIAAWLTQGEYWVYTGNTGWGEKYFLGNNRNWYTVLVTDELTIADTLPQFLRAYLNAQGETAGERLDWMITQWLETGPDKQTWRYHMIAYPEMTQRLPEADPGSYVWESDFRLHLLRGTSLKALHLNPYVRTVLLRGKLAGLVRREEDSWVNDKYATPLRLKSNNLIPEDNLPPSLYCEDGGWRLVIGKDASLPEELLSAHGLTAAYHGWWVPQPKDKDRVETVEAFVLAMDWAAIQYGNG